MCCLKYEQDVYEEKLARLPQIGAIVKTDDGIGEVCSIETLKERVKVKLKDGDDTFYRRYDAKDIKLIKNPEKKVDQHNDENIESIEDIKELEKLEKLDKMEQKNENDF